MKSQIAINSLLVFAMSTALAAAIDGRKTIATEHWSFLPTQRSALPRLSSNEISSAVDAFIQTRLQQAGLEPSPAADRETLIRRLYLDMLGLPPTPEEVGHFSNDRSADAYARLVDRVLSSPHYGPRWARHWLDVVRFAESHGFESNMLRPNAYHFRDYVVKAWNEDRPYDRFILEQLAGDALGVDAATGFLVGGAYDRVKSPDIKLTLMQRQNELADMIDTTGTAFLGLTTGCARCHDHKFDPILQTDYYALQAVFAGVQHGERELGGPLSEQRSKRLEQLRDQITEAVVARQQMGIRPPVNAHQNEERFDPVVARFVRFTILDTNQKNACIDELEIYSTGSDGVPRRNVALASSGAMATSSDLSDLHENKEIRHSRRKHRLSYINDGRRGDTRSWICSQRRGGWVSIQLAEPLEINRVVWSRDRHQKFQDRLATEYKIEVALDPGEWTTVANSEDRLPYVTAVGNNVDPNSSHPDSGHPNSSHPSSGKWSAEQLEQGRRLVANLVSLRLELDEISPRKAYAGTFKQPDKTYVLYRGDPLSRRQAVTPDAPAVFSSLGLTIDAPEQQRRLKLARWIANPDNPLTARVLVNRIWHYHFGTGIVSTPNDFGAKGAQPTHPRILDWLADEFVRGGWSIKHIHRHILLSHTYSQSSLPRQNAQAIDSDCRLLWRFPPRRLEAEAIRDSILYVAGTMDSKMSGAGFNVFDVEGVNDSFYFVKQEWGPAEWRRMIYMTHVRQELDPVFGAFDCPDGNQAAPRRGRLTTPLQALNLLNSPFIIQQAQLLAVRLQRDAGDRSGDQVRRAFRLCYGRHPEIDEMAVSVKIIADHGLDVMCRGLLNTSEFLSIP